MLCESGWNGGGGYTPEEVGKMTLDQIWFRLCDMEILKKKVGERTENVKALGGLAKIKPDKDGFIRGRAADGTPIKGRIRGKSLARELMEKAEEERKNKAKK